MTDHKHEHVKCKYCYTTIRQCRCANTNKLFTYEVCGKCSMVPARITFKGTGERLNYQTAQYTRASRVWEDITIGETIFRRPTKIESLLVFEATQDATLIVKCRTNVVLRCLARTFEHGISDEERRELLQFDVNDEKLPKYLRTRMVDLPVMNLGEIMRVSVENGSIGAIVGYCTILV